MKQIKNIKDMENILDRHIKCIKMMEESLERFEKAQEEYDRLKNYYTYGDYLKDYEDYEKGKIPKDIKCGVLSEDAVFNLIGDNYHLAIKMLEVATKIIKNN